MKQKNFETILYSTAGVAVMFLVLLALYVVTSAFKGRLDLTSDRAFSLSQGTKNILAHLDSRVTIRFYCTQNEVSMPAELRTYAQHVEDLLNEYKEAAHGKIVVQKLDPKPDSDAEDSARLDGVGGQATSAFGDKVYLGLSISRLEQKVALPWLPPNRERLLEYDISRAIARVVHPTLSLVGVMSALPIFGGAANPAQPSMGQPSQEPAAFIGEIKKDFTVREVPLTATQIDPDINVMLVVHPRDISDATQYALDQFVLRGGKLLAFIDPHAYFDQKHDQMAQVLGESSGQSSLDVLMKGWGLSMDSTKVVADMTFAARNPQTGSSMPTVLLINKEGINGDDVVTGQIDNLVMPYAGALMGKAVEGLQETVLAHSSRESELVDTITAGIAGDQIVKDFKPSNVEYALAVRLTGKFKTAFPAGAPKAPGSTATNQAAPLTVSTNTTAVIIVADSDMLNDQVCVQVQEILGYRMVRPMNGNLNFVESLVEQLSGDSDLITLRSRASLDRPFTRLKDMQAKAGRKFEEEVKNLEASKAATEQHISELQAHKSGNEQQFILSPEQQKELENYQKQVADGNKHLRIVRKELARDTDSLEFWTKVVNIGAMPVLVALTGIVLALMKRKKTAAK